MENKTKINKFFSTIFYLLFIISIIINIIAIINIINYCNPAFTFYNNLFFNNMFCIIFVYVENILLIIISSIYTYKTLKEKNILKNIIGPIAILSTYIVWFPICSAFDIVSLSCMW